MANSGGGLPDRVRSHREREGRNRPAKAPGTSSKTTNAPSPCRGHSHRPPVFGLEIYRLGTEPRAVAVVVPRASTAALIFRGEYFGCPNPEPR